ncbi:hypothetical protein DL96DRAFT_1556732 [Flagelloscypha sp. PMI_526]|nr:hypothetical protein DL96DRAFT_1556732 [Flagelloscypha sp. PMI_526]
MKMFLTAQLIAVVGVAQAYDFQLPVAASFHQIHMKDDANYENMAVQLAMYDLTEERLIHVFGEDRPRMHVHSLSVTEGEKLKLLDSYQAFFDITEHPDFTSRVILPKPFNAHKLSRSLTTKDNLLVESITDDLDDIVENLKADALQLTSFWTRSYNSQWGLYSSNWIYEHMNQLLAMYPSNKVNCSITRFPHKFPQNSIIVRIESTESTIPSEDRDILIVGAHQDSINYKYPFFRAPVLIPPPNIAVELHWYAAEEGGTLGSIDIASFYLSLAKPVKAMVQMDGVMSVPVDKEPLIAIIDTNSNTNLTAFATNWLEIHELWEWVWERSLVVEQNWISEYLSERMYPFTLPNDTVNQPGFNFTHGAEFVKFYRIQELLLPRAIEFDETFQFYLIFGGVNRRYSQLSPHLWPVEINKRIGRFEFVETRHGGDLVTPHYISVATIWAGIKEEGRILVEAKYHQSPMNDTFISASLQLSALDIENSLISIAVVLYWDHLLTLPEEILYLWKRPVCTGAALFFFNRYLTSMGNIPVLYYIFLEGNPVMCGIFTKYHQALIIVPQLTVTVQLSWPIPQELLLLDGASQPHLEPMKTLRVVAPQPGLSKEVAVRRAIPWAAILAYNIVVFLLTLAKSYQGINWSGRVPGIGITTRAPLLDVMLRDDRFISVAWIIVDTRLFSVCYPFVQNHAQPAQAP